MKENHIKLALKHVRVKRNIGSYFEIPQHRWVTFSKLIFYLKIIKIAFPIYLIYSIIFSANI